MTSWSSLVVLSCAACAACGRLRFDAVGDAGGTGDGTSDATSGDGTIDATAASLGFVQGTMTTNEAGPTTSVTFPSPIAAGDTIVVFVWSWGPQANAAPPGCVTDTAATSYGFAAAVQSVAGTCGGMNVGGGVFFAHAGAAISSDTVTYTSGNTENGVVAVEYTGALVFDFATEKMNAPMGPPGQVFGTDPVAVSTVPELLVSLGIPCAGAGGSVSWINNDGYTIRGYSTDTAGQPAMAGDKLALQPGSYDASWAFMFLANPSVAAALLVGFR